MKRFLVCVVVAAAGCGGDDRKAPAPDPSLPSTDVFDKSKDVKPATKAGPNAG